MITKQTRKDLFKTDSVEQIGSKQLFIVNGTALVSYTTIVGKLMEDTWYLSTEKYSVTTTKQCTQFANEQLRKGFKVERVAELFN